ncbi:hypothetical protein CSC2_32090 [Clostridium zeae]|uniref:Uncharacterized protein n=1 Tax=Clostridium zeae TaxID=2759022 RepID=A0ABQ1EDC1_9CLOT|nr:hypothetical protein CSC2_32090 [Clostridium zeae]
MISFIRYSIYNNKYLLIIVIDNNKMLMYDEVIKLLKVIKYILYRGEEYDKKN